MKYYSEVLNKVFDTEKACSEAEAKYQAEVEAKKAAEAKKAETRKARAAEVEAAMKAAREARAKYDKLLQEFCKDYGAFHYSFTDGDEDIFDFFRFL